LTDIGFFGTDYKFLLDGFSGHWTIDYINQLLQQNYNGVAGFTMAIMPCF
jgi:hypothetical protein